MSALPTAAPPPPTATGPPPATPGVRRPPSPVPGVGGGPVRSSVAPWARGPFRTVRGGCPNGDSEAVAAALPSWAEAACRAAVDPLEVVTTLEVCGVTATIAAERFAAPDVAALGGRLFRQLPLRAMPVTGRRLPRAGNGWDLLRGVTLVVPGLLLASVGTGLGLHLSWWVLPLAVMVGWSLSQVLGATAAMVDGRGRDPGRALTLCAAAGLLVAAAAGWSARRGLGGDRASVWTVVAVVAYLGACAVLVSRRRLWVVGAALVPAVGALGATVDPRLTHVSDHRAALVAAAAGGATVVVALWSLRSGRARPGRLAVPDLGRLALYAGHGVGAALLTSAMALAMPRVTPGGWPLELYPLLAAFGVMEWQLRTLRHRCAAAMARCTDPATFATAARRAYARSAGVHLVALSVACGLVAGWLALHGRPVPVLAPVGVLALGADLFAALVLLARGRASVVVGAWVVAAAVGASVWALTAAAPVPVPGRAMLARELAWRLGTAAPTHGPALAAVAAAALAALMVLTYRAGVVCRPFEHV